MIMIIESSKRYTLFSLRTKDYFNSILNILLTFYKTYWILLNINK